jgi:hypothetical protein
VNQRNNVTHATRQVPSGKWTSKLGVNIDIEHNLVGSLEDAGLTDEEYGKVVQFLKRPIKLKPALSFSAPLALPAPRT